jgi:hypothetical protein
MKTETVIGLIGGVLLGESLKSISEALLVEPFFGADPGVGGHVVIAFITLAILAHYTDRYDA